MDFEKHSVSRAQFEENLFRKAGDPAFLSDIAPLLAPRIQYDPMAAMRQVEAILIQRLHGEPWRKPDSGAP